MARWLLHPWVRFALFLVVVGFTAAYTWRHWPEFLRSQRAGPRPAVTQSDPARPVVSSPATTALSTAAPNGALNASLNALPTPSGPPAATTEPGDFFAAYRLNRDQSRGVEREMLKELLDSPTLADAARQDAQARYVQLGRRISLEAELENLLRARGYADALVSVAEQAANVVLKADAITPPQAAAIADLVRLAAGIRPEAVRIMTRAG